MKTVVEGVVALLIVAVAYGLAGKWDYEAELEDRLPAPQVDAAINAAYLRGRTDGARAATMHGCNVRQMFGTAK